MSVFFFLAGATTFLTLLLVFQPWLFNRRKELSVARRAAWHMALITCVGAAGIYWIFGQPQLIDPIAHAQHQQHVLQQRAAELRSFLRDPPKHASADRSAEWAELGDIAMQLQRYDEAKEAYRHAVVASQGHPVALLAYGKALTFAAGGSVTPDALKAFQMAFVQDRNLQEAQYFIAMERLQARDFHQAKILFAALHQEMVAAPHADANVQGLEPAVRMLLMMLDRQMAKEAASDAAAETASTPK